MSIETLGATPTNMAVLNAFATTMTAYPSGMMKARKGQFPRLRKLRFMSYCSYRRNRDGTSLSDETIQSLKVYHRLVGWLAQYQEEIVYEAVRTRPQAVEESDVLSNEEIGRLLKLAQAEVRRPEKMQVRLVEYAVSLVSSWDGNKDQQRLYHGSRVRADGSCLIPKGWGVMLLDCLRYLGVRSWAKWWLPGREEVYGGLAGLALTLLAKADPRLDAIITTVARVVVAAECYTITVLSLLLVGLSWHLVMARYGRGRVQ